MVSKLTDIHLGLLIGPAGIGTAIVSVDIGTGSVHVNLLFRGIVKEGQTKVPFQVRFEINRDGEKRILEETATLQEAGSVSSVTV